MSFGASNNKKLKPFVTEDEARDLTVKRQEEWERVRKPEDPLERPEEAIDHRSLFEQLQEQKEKAQQEHDEKYNLKNMIRGIDNGEAAFLEFASQQQAEIDGRRFAITSEVQEFRSEVAQLQAAVPSGPSAIIKEKKKPVVLQSKKKSQLDLLSGVIKPKRKRSETCDAGQDKLQEKLVDNAGAIDRCVCPAGERKDESGGKKQRISVTSDDDSGVLSGGQQQDHQDNAFSNNSVYKPGRISSLNVYSDSSDSESSSSDSHTVVIHV